MDNFQLVAVARDLVRRPDIAHVARILASLNDRTDASPLHIIQAKKLVDDPVKRDVLITALQLFAKGK